MQPGSGSSRFGFWMGIKLALIANLMAAGIASAAVTGDGVWKSADASQAAGKTARITPNAYQLFALDGSALSAKLKGAPLEFTPAAKTGAVEVQLPDPTGAFQRFLVVESRLSLPNKSGKPSSATYYSGQGVDDKSANVRIVSTAYGIYASVLTPNGAWYVDPYLKGDNTLYVSYFKKDDIKGAPFKCLVEQVAAKATAAPGKKVSSGDNLRTYRAAVAGDAEYTAYQNNLAGGADPVADALAAIQVAVARVSQVYENDVAIRLTLISDDNEKLIIFTDSATDGYTNGDPNSMINENQTIIDAAIGDANYDIGHVFGTDSGGLAAAGVCSSGNKAHGVTGSGAPTGDPFYIDYVAHEMGHQFSGDHTFNSTTSNCGGGNRNASTAYEPGSGSTIMAYAGICGSDDLQPNSDPYFHGISLDQIIAYSTSGGASGCPGVTPTGNTIPSVSAGANYVIPPGTAFALTATGSDGDGDPLTYCWEEFDLGVDQTLSDPDNGSSPIFRSFSPTSSPTRTFPQLSSILSGTLDPGEKYPAVDRMCMNFRVTARDNRANGGAVNSAETCVEVLDVDGPFRVTFPNSAAVLSCDQTITWDTAGASTENPYGVSAVNILLSIDGGQTFPYVLAANTPNDGSEVVTFPNVGSTQARIKIEAVGSIFFDISDANFTVSGADIEVNTTVLDLGVLCPGQVNYGQLEIFNTGCYDLQVTGIAQLGTPNPAFSLVPSDGAPQPQLPQTILPGDHIDYTFKFTGPNPPPNAQSVIYTISSSDPARPTIDVQLVGTVGSPVVRTTVENGGVFGNVCSGSNKTLNVQVSNVGDCAATVNTLGLSGTNSSEFSFTPDRTLPASLASGDHLNVAVTFAPPAYPSETFNGKTATLAVGSTDPVNPTINVPLTGNTPPPAISTLMEAGGLYGTVCRGSAKSLSLTILNQGQCSLTISNITRSAGDTEFAVSSAVSFPITISPGNNLVVPVTFTAGNATTFGAHAATISVSSDDPASPTRNVSVSGTVGNGALTALIANGGAFGNVCLGSHSDLDLTINNSGTCDLTISAISSSSGEFLIPTAISLPAVVHAGGSLPLAVRFQPTSLGLGKTANITITSDDPTSPKLVPVTGSCPSATIATSIANGGNFGNVCLGSFADLNLTINNSGLCNLSISSIGSSSAEFLVPSTVSFPLVVLPGGQLTIPLRFQPTSRGLGKVASFTINSNDPVTPAKGVGVTGSSPNPTIVTQIADTGDFGDVCRYSFKDLDLNINNSGLCDLNITAISSSSVDFLVPSTVTFPQVVHPGDSLQIPLRFQPTSFGQKSGNFTISSNDPAHPSSVIAVRGNCPSGKIRVQPCPVDFGTVCPEDLPAHRKTVTICDVGTCPLNIQSISISGAEFSLDDLPMFPLRLEPGTCQTFIVVYSPANIGCARGQVTIVSDDPADPIHVCDVTACTPASTISVPARIAFPPTVIQPNGPCVGEQALQIESLGPCNAIVTSVTVSGPDAPAFTLDGLSTSSVPVILAPGENLGDGFLKVLFKPTAILTKRFYQAQINVTSEINPITHLTTTTVIMLAGEGVQTGMRILVTKQGIPVQSVSNIQVKGTTGQTAYNKRNLLLRHVDGPIGFEDILSFDFHEEFGGLSAPTQRLTGNYRITVTIKDGRKQLRRSVNFNADTCTFNPTLNVNF